MDATASRAADRELYHSLGRTVVRAREEAALHDALERKIDESTGEFQALRSREVHARLRRFVEEEKAGGRLALSPETPTPPSWRIKNFLHLIAFPLFFLIALPLLIVLAPFFVFRLRQLEKSDPELCDRCDQNYSDELARAEDRLLTNQFTAMGTLKPDSLG